MTDVFLLHCSVSANLRQSTQIKLDDLKLPKSVVETLEKQHAVSVRPTLSGKLKEYLGNLRLLQRRLYEECTIHNGDIHFLCHEHFVDATKIISEIRLKAHHYNQKLKGIWIQEYELWSATVSGFLDPLFKDDVVGLKIAKEAYLKLFPTQKEFEDPIHVNVIGPNPILLSVASTADQHFTTEVQELAAANTNQVLEAARKGAADRALGKAAELLDDLDVRVSSKVGERQTGGAKRRGSWQVTAETLHLISSHCPGFDALANLADQLREVGIQLQDKKNSARVKDTAFARYNVIKGEIRSELERLVKERDSSEGLETLKQSLALSGTYRDLISKIQTATSQEQLDGLASEINTEQVVYEQRAKHLHHLFTQREELLHARNVSIDEVKAEIENLHAATIDDLDF